MTRAIKRIKESKAVESDEIPGKVLKFGEVGRYNMGDV